MTSRDESGAAIWEDSRLRANIRRKLLKWFAQNARTLPWRSEPTPYRVWVSEVMLQQTQVATVLPYFERFLKSFPDIDSLAAAEEADLMSHWEGLGYYRRARSLHAAAKQVVQQHGGVFPVQFAEVLALPGIGRYTAGAILSISGDQRLPIVEGNTQRVFSRWFGLREPPAEREAAKTLWQVAQAMLPARTGSGTFNQAAMELGALVCTPRSPRCDRCPVHNHCEAHRLGIEEEIPGKVKKIQYEDRTEFAFVIAQQGKAKSDAPPSYLMRPLPDGVRWSGLWDFPRTIQRSMESVTEAARELSRTMDLEVRPGDELTVIKHAVTKYRIRLRTHYAVLKKTTPPIESPWRYVTVRQMEDLPMSVTGRKIAKLLAKANG